MMFKIVVSVLICSIVSASDNMYYKNENSGENEFMCPSCSIPHISFEMYNRYDDIDNYLHGLAEYYPLRVKAFSIGNSFENRNMTAVAISNGDGRKDKKTILVDAGMDGCEWIGPATALYVIHQLVESFSENKHLLQEYDWVIVPLINPDGYEFSHTQDPNWLKNVKPSSDKCFGTYLNHNFEFGWNESRASKDPCDESFKGHKPFSEPESANLARLMYLLKNNTKFYLTLHTFGGRLLYSWRYSRNDKSSAWRNMDEVARAGADAIRNATSSIYRVGTAGGIFSPAAGGSNNYAHEVLKIPISISMVLTPRRTGYQPERKYITKFVSEGWIGIKAMAEKVISMY